jgi:Flp pilus assembly protein TadD
VAARPEEPAIDGDAQKAACRKAFNNGAGKYKSIIAACEPVLAADPNAADVMVMMAETELNRGRYRESREWSEKALVVEPTLPEPYVFIGQAEQQAGRKKEARAAYEKYLQLAPAGKYAKDVRAIVPTLPPL